MTDALAEDRRKSDPRVDQLVTDVASLKGEVAANTALTQEVRDATAGLVEFVRDSRDAFRLFNKIMKGLRWIIRNVVIPIALLVGTFYAFTHGGKFPGWVKAIIEAIS